jgi:hypothetical protein
VIVLRKRTRIGTEATRIVNEVARSFEAAANITVTVPDAESLELRSDQVAHSELRLMTEQALSAASVTWSLHVVFEERAG